MTGRGRSGQRVLSFRFSKAARAGCVEVRRESQNLLQLKLGLFILPHLDLDQGQRIACIQIAGVYLDHLQQLLGCLPMLPSGVVDRRQAVARHRRGGVKLQHGPEHGLGVLPTGRP